jgi:hypothetical protein
VGRRWKDHLDLGDEESIWLVSGNIKGIGLGRASLVLVGNLVFDMAFQEMIWSW